jgi:hypothetical protein
LSPSKGTHSDLASFHAFSYQPKLALVGGKLLQ